MHIGKILLTWAIIAIVVIVGLFSSGMVQVDVEVKQKPDDSDDPKGKHHKKS